MLVCDPASAAGVLNISGFCGENMSMTGVQILSRLLVSFVPIGHHCSHPFLKSSSDYKVSEMMV